MSGSQEARIMSEIPIITPKKRRDLVLHKTNITKLLKHKYTRLKKTGWITLLNAPIEHYIDINNEAIGVLLEDLDYQGIYITVNKPYTELLKIFAERGVNTSKLRFIDAISQTYGITAKETKQCKYVFGPLNIEGIVNAVEQFLTKPKKHRKTFVFIDSITTILLYNHLPRTVRFSQFLTKKLRSLDISGIMVSVTSGLTSERLIKELKQLCDEVIDIEGEGCEIKQ